MSGGFWNSERTRPEKGLQERRGEGPMTEAGWSHGDVLRANICPSGCSRPRPEIQLSPQPLPPRPGAQIFLVCFPQALFSCDQIGLGRRGAQGKPFLIIPRNEVGDKPWGLLCQQPGLQGHLLTSGHVAVLSLQRVTQSIQTIETPGPAPDLLAGWAQ